MSVVLDIEWLAPPESPAYHGAEWPPSPMRLMQALVASASRLPVPDRSRARKVLQQLESYPPPTIHAPRGRRGKSVTSAVPDNDADVAWRELQRLGGARGEREFRNRSGKLQSLRKRDGYLLSGGARYVWNADLEHSDTKLLTRLAHGVTHVGQGVDLALVQLGDGAAAGPPGSITFTPDQTATDTYAVPYPGALNDIDERYAHELRRISAGGVAGPMRTPRGGAVHGYTRSDRGAPNRYAVFRLRRGMAPWASAPDGALELAAMVRHALDQTARRAGMPDEARAAVMGHRGGGRIHAVPAPNAGHRWADGYTRRVMLVAPADVPRDIWDVLSGRMAAASLVRDNAPREEEVLLERMAAVDLERDAALRRYIAPSHRWTSAVPAVLPGFDRGRKGRPRTAKTIRRMLRFAGFGWDGVAWADLHVGAIATGGRRAGDYPVPAHLRKYPRKHVTIEFHEAIPGPILLGAGIGWGLGLLVACE